MSFLNYHQCAGTIAMMYNDTDKRQFTRAYSNLVAYTQSILPVNQFLHLVESTVTYHEMGRNEIVERSLGDWVFMSDSDHVMAPDLLTRLLYLRTKYNTKILSAMYLRKYEPHLPVCNNWLEDDKIEPLLTWDREADIIPVGMVGGGGLLVDRSVYIQMLNEFKCGPFTLLPGLSEDFSFCKRAKDMGIQVWLAPKVETHHLMTGSPIIAVRDYFPLPVK